MAAKDNAPGSPKLSVVAATEDAPLMYLEICRGKTGFRQRPVCSPNFLIGSGPGCDLRLGGGDIPEAHSVLLVLDQEAAIQWLGEDPPLLVNGEPVQEAILNDEDHICIGRFDFLIHHEFSKRPSQAEDLSHESQPQADSTAELSELLNLVAQGKAEEHDEDLLSQLSATELAEQLEADLESVEQFEEAIRQGESALLFAAAERAEELLAESPQPDLASEDADEVLAELEKVIQQLSGFSAELDERAARIASHEASQSEAAELLLAAQKQLAEQLERFHRQVVDTQEPDEPILRKAA